MWILGCKIHVSACRRQRERKAKSRPHVLGLGANDYMGTSHMDSAVVVGDGGGGDGGGGCGYLLNRKVVLSDIFKN